MLMNLLDFCRFSVNQHLNSFCSEEQKVCSEFSVFHSLVTGYTHVFTVSRDKSSVRCAAS